MLECCSTLTHTLYTRTLNNSQLRVYHCVLLQTVYYIVYQCTIVASAIAADAAHCRSNNVCYGWSFQHPLQNSRVFNIYFHLSTFMINNRWTATINTSWTVSSSFSHIRSHILCRLRFCFVPFFIRCATLKRNGKHFKFGFLNYDRIIYNLPT